MMLLLVGCGSKQDSPFLHERGSGDATLGVVAAPEAGWNLVRSQGASAKDSHRRRRMTCP